MEEKNYDLVTEARDGYPKIFWDKDSEGIRYDYEMAYEVIG